MKRHAEREREKEGSVHILWPYKIQRIHSLNSLSIYIHTQKKKQIQSPMQQKMNLERNKLYKQTIWNMNFCTEHDVIA